MKRKIIASCLAIAATSFLTAGITKLEAFAETAQTQSVVNIEQITDLGMEEGASVRVGSNQETRNCGLRFTMMMSAANYAALKANTAYTDLQFGVFISTASYNITGYEIADETHLMGESALYYWQVGTENDTPVYSVENPNTTTMRQILCASGSEMLVSEDGNAYFYGTATNLKDENIQREYVGIGFIRYTQDEQTHYKFATENDNVRTMEYIARAAWEEEENYRTALEALYLSKVPHNCTVINAPVAKESLRANGEAQALIEAGEADAYSKLVYSLDQET